MPSEDDLAHFGPYMDANQALEEKLRADIQARVTEFEARRDAEINTLRAENERLRAVVDVARKTKGLWLDMEDLWLAIDALDEARKAEECKKCLGLGAVNSPVRGYEDYDSLTPCPECLGTGGRGKEG